MDTEFCSWTKVVFAVVFLVVGSIVFRDYHSAPVEWRAGRVTDKEIHRSYRRQSSPFSYYTSYYIVVDSGGAKGSVSVDSLTYSDWHTGDACEIASHHGHYMNYDFTDLRRPQYVER